MKITDIVAFHRIAVKVLREHYNQLSQISLSIVIEEDMFVDVLLQDPTLLMWLYDYCELGYYTSCGVFNPNVDKHVRNLIWLRGDKTLSWRNLDHLGNIVVEDPVIVNRLERHKKTIMPLIRNVCIVDDNEDGYYDNLGFAAAVFAEPRSYNAEELLLRAIKTKTTIWGHRFTFKTSEHGLPYLELI